MKNKKRTKKKLIVGPNDGLHHLGRRCVQNGPFAASWQLALVGVGMGMVVVGGCGRSGGDGGRAERREGGGVDGGGGSDVMSWHGDDAATCFVITAAANGM
jgi:hypothetical protein